MNRINGHFWDDENYCEHCGSGPDCAICGRDDREFLRQLEALACSAEFRHGEDSLIARTYRSAADRLAYKIAVADRAGVN